MVLRMPEQVARRASLQIVREQLWILSRRRAGCGWRRQPPCGYQGRQRIAFLWLL